MDIAATHRNGKWKGWPLLALLQAVVSVVLFHDYLFGDKYFAFMDVGSDTFQQFVPTLMYMASPANWGSTWSFKVGLGASAPLNFDPYTLLGIAAGPAHVLDLRIWVYVAKIFTGGAVFYAFASSIGTRREAALIVALAYSFCGFVMINGQWDPQSTEFVAYPLILWSFVRQATRGSAWLIPVSIAFAMYAGAFIFSIGVFVIYAVLAATIASDRPAATAVRWLRSVFPKCLIGLALAGPVVLSLIYRFLDSPRITGAQSAFGNRLREIFTFNDDTTILIELAGFFDKNLLGVGNGHFGWMNYLESPGFYVGMLALMVIPQLWRGERTDRRILIAAGITLGLFIMLPAIRYFAFGFGLDYFRVNNLWVSILLLALFARALEIVAERGVGSWLLAGTFAALALVLIQVRTGLLPPPSVAHEIKITIFACTALLLLGMLARRFLQWRQFAMLALVLVAAEAATMSYPSFHEKREVVTRRTPGYGDATLPALEFLRTRDSGFYRVEKTYNSVSFCDALAQNYMGVKSYWFQGAGVTGFFADLDLLPRRSRIKNYTNWLPNFGERFALYSVVGVKYIIADRTLDWPGFRKIRETAALSIYENDFALPLGVLYERQYLREQLARMPPEARDITLMNAAIVDRLRTDTPKLFDAGQFASKGADWLEENYRVPARLLQRRGLIIENFSPGNVVGRIESDVPGVLVFSIPFSRGWSVAIDGVEQPVFSANLGMLAVDAPEGRHHVELRYSLPGLIPGLFVALLGILVLGLTGASEHRLRLAKPSSRST